MEPTIKNLSDYLPLTEQSVMLLKPGTKFPIEAKIRIGMGKSGPFTGTVFRRDTVTYYPEWDGEEEKGHDIDEADREKYHWWYISDANKVSMVDLVDLANSKQDKEDHGLTKYDRPIKGSKQGTIDVYAVIETFDVRCPARQHAIKKILCTGIRGKGSPIQDLEETKVAIDRAIQLQKEREGVDN